MKPQYLGDGVYIQRNEYNQLVLTTGNHEVALASNVIYLEPEVVLALLHYINTKLK